MSGYRACLTRAPSASGLMLAALFLAASLSPSLLPRTEVIQGTLSGVCLATGYGIGVILETGWLFLGLPRPRPDAVSRSRLVATFILLATAAITLPSWTAGQNEIRTLMMLEPLEGGRPAMVALIAVIVASIVILAARIAGIVRATVTARVGPIVPPRIAVIVGLAAATGLTLAIGDGIIFRQLLRIADASFREVDLIIEPAHMQPVDAMITGSPLSLVAWESLGRRGREFIATTPSADEIAVAVGGAALRPVRVYVGLGSAPTPRDRARLAVAELERAGGFDRGVLVVATPTGTGWMDPASSFALEYLHRGNVATVAVQYSYLASWLSLLVEPGYGVESARAVFDAVYDRWRSIPASDRPRLYLHGLSLGALASEASTDLLHVIDDPFDGALWSGPPFRSAGWHRAVAGRDPRSPAWLPRYRDGAAIRFANQGGVVPGDAPWGRLRIVYLQYASDPVTFFEPTSAFRPPEWLSEPRAPDVSVRLRWLPIITFLQLAFDMATAATAPVGYGRVYAAQDYLRAWAEVTGSVSLERADLDLVALALSGLDMSP